MTDTNAADDATGASTDQTAWTDPATALGATGGRAAADGADAAPGLPTDDVDWGALRTAATAAMRHAYAPYSSFPVGAAALTDDGRIVSGCNVENASYGVTLCAECSLVSQLHMTGGGKLVAFTCVDGDGATLMPCGRCRQLLFEHSTEGMLLETVSGIRTIDEVLPDAFGPRTLATYLQEH
jgi:cytidine deaminase